MSKAARSWLAVVAVVVAASVPAGLLSAGASTASTTGCGSACSSPSVKSLGTGEVLAVGSTTTTPAGTTTSVVMSAASTSNSAEDWTLVSEAQVSQAVGAGVVPSQLDMNYSGDTLVEFQYVPDGLPSDKCLADVSVTTSSVGVTQCGITTQTLWIVDALNAVNGYVDLINAGYEAAIPGESSVYAAPFAEPYVLSVNSSNGVVLAPLSQLGSGVASTQLWANITSPSQSALRAKLDKPR